MNNNEFNTEYYFNNYYYDSRYNNNESIIIDLDEIFYEGTNIYIIFEHNCYYYQQDDTGEVNVQSIKLYYYIYNPNEKLSLREIFAIIDEQSVDYSILQYTNHVFIEGIIKKNDITYEILCGS